MSRWLAWLATKMTGASTSSRSSSPRTSGDATTWARGARDVVDDHRARQADRVAPGPGGVVVHAQVLVSGAVALDGSPATSGAAPREARAQAPEPAARRRAASTRLRARAGRAHRTSASRIGGACRWVIVGSRPTTSSAISSASASVDRRLEPEPPHRGPVAADDDHRARGAEGVRAPVPHVERVHAVVGVARPVEVDVPRVGGEGLLVLARSRPGRSSRPAPLRRSRCSSGDARGGTPTASGGT